MSQQTVSFDAAVAEAADCYVAREGSAEAAIEAVAARREAGEVDAGRAEEAIAYLRYAAEGGG